MTESAQATAANLQEMLIRNLAQIRCVLVGPSHPGNIGAAARALKTMGLSRLVIVAPRFDDALTQPDALAFASGATDVLAAARQYATLDEALTGCHWALALTARTREFSPVEMSARAAATQAIERIANTAEGAIAPEIAFVFGNERYGLDNVDVLKCHARCFIPANPAYSSLNLAQAVQLVAYECRMALLEGLAAAPVNILPAVISDPAPHEDREQMFVHLEQALVAIGYLDPEQPKKLMPRLRRMFSRNGLEREEIHILRGICKAILKRPPLP